jgi:hypothetical protein
MTASANIEELSATEALKRYVAHLIAESWCIDMSAYPLKGLQATSDRNCAVEKFAYGFRKWAIANSVRVRLSEYRAFRKTLQADVIERLPHVLGSSFRPTAERFITSRGALLANTYIPHEPAAPAVIREPPDVTAYLDRLFPNKADRDHVVRFMAHIVQFPERRPQHGLIITGDPGTGKSSLIEILRLALGNRYVWQENSYAPVFKPFSEVLPNSLVICADDATASRDTYERLKHAITSDYQEVELKGVQKTVLRDVYARMIILSNDTRPVKLGAGDRRFYVTQRCVHPVSPEESAEFFAVFRQYLDKGTTPSELYHWLKTVPLDGFLVGSTPQTAAHAQMVEEGISTLERLVRDYVEDQPIFHEAQLLAHLKVSGISFPKPDEVARKLSGAGYHRRRREVSGCASGKQVQLWTPAGCRRARKLTDKEEEAIRAVLNAAQTF